MAGGHALAPLGGNSEVTYLYCHQGGLCAEFFRLTSPPARGELANSLICDSQVIYLTRLMQNAEFATRARQRGEVKPTWRKISAFFRYLLDLRFPSAITTLRFL